MFKQVKVGDMKNLSYVIGCDKTKRCAFVDPAWEEDKLFEAAEGYKPVAILLTHTHFDHTEAVERVKERYPDIRIYVHSNDEEKIDGSTPISDGSVIEIGEIRIKVLHTPGHTSASVCYIFDDKLLTGDTLFINTIGRTDLPTGSASEMFNSIFNVIGGLSDDLQVYPGHSYGGVTKKLGEIRETNRYLQQDGFEQFYDLRGGNP